VINTMTQPIVRQPIFTNKEQVWAYKLKHKDELADQLLAECQEISNNKIALIDATNPLLRKLLADTPAPDLIAPVFKREQEYADDITELSKKLKRRGYRLAFENFVFQRKFLSLLPLIDMVKIDFAALTPELQKKIRTLADKFELKLLITDLASRDHYQQALEDEFEYFHGDFYTEPRYVSNKDIQVYSINYFQALEEINQEDVDVIKLAEIIKRDASLSYKLLTLINSAAFGIRSHVNSLNQAIMLLGLKEMRKWLNLIVIKEMASEKEAEVIRLALVRARFCELIATEKGDRLEQEKYFMTGLFSLLDVILKRRLKSLLAELPIHDIIKQAILDKEGVLSLVYQLILACEKADWSEVETLREEIGIEEEIIGEKYLESLKWCDEIMALNLAFQEEG